MKEFDSPVSLGRRGTMSVVRRAIQEASVAEENGSAIAAKARGLMVGYDARWANDVWRAVQVGTTFHLPIINPDSGRRSRTFTRAGRCGGIVEGGGRRLLLVLRTAAESIDEDDSLFWQRSAVDWQAGTCHLAVVQKQVPSPVCGKGAGGEGLLERNTKSSLDDRPGQFERHGRLDGILYDVLRRPAIRPRAIPKGSSRKTDEGKVGTLDEIARQSTYFGRPLDESQRRAVLEGDGRETAELYAMRLEADALRRPDWYFHRRVFRYDRRQAVRDQLELWQTATEMRVARRTGNHWRNSQSCHRHGRPCPFLPLCSGTDTPDSDRWRPVESLHPELGSLPADVDSDRVLTHTRMQCFKLCRRRHYYRYELGIVPVRPQADETLRLARMIHRALLAWWLAKRNERHGTTNGGACHAD